jgi:hypothetical protein
MEKLIQGHKHKLFVGLFPKEGTIENVSSTLKISQP